ncbi:uncharacterized protein BX663DRAFT_459516 [Cokeromyces recurvatus]|uniref:uncharacterized protein n=1 Tax=Cokeromyces recurvatus TaxID=90255 RepID=UPI00221EBB50|nr:uncharacterized protein BX663DRAFT_459516 [Cokeromyces recurvatus]KAI7899852.1 hypothetical protein BX663DRAFT_459516 [Cokeromyces recurvatus]
MQLTLERFQFMLTELSDVTQFILAIFGLIAILLPIFQKLSFYTPNCITVFLHKILILLGIPQLMIYVRPQEYYDNLSKQLIESELANDSKESDICLDSNIEADDETALISGLVNMGNTCFLNSVLQALSSLLHLHIYLKHISYISNHTSLPVTRSLLKTIRALTMPRYRYTSFRPLDIITALSSNRRIINREQQDAQEFFQLVSSAIDTEGQKVVKSLDNGLRVLLQKHQHMNTLENPFIGLLANRLSCMECGYTSAIRHFSFNNIQLNVPNRYTTSLEECLSQFTSIEYLQDASCRRCSFVTTIKALTAEIETLKQQSKRQSNKKKKRELLTQLVSLEKVKQEIENRLKMGRIEEENDQDRLLKSVSCMSTKQVMLAKPPKILCLHISRSAFLHTGAVYKNSCHLIFPEYLDLSPFCTNGTLNTRPNMPISVPSEQHQYYKLMSVVVHYGSHSFGHFVAFKRRIYTNQCQCCECNRDKGLENWKCQNDTWYRISDTKVELCSVEDVMRSNPYMLLYELINKKENPSINTTLLLDEEGEEEEEEIAMDDSSSSSDVISSEEEEDELNASKNVYNTIIPTDDDAAKEALRIANSLIMKDNMLLAAK